MVVIEKLLQFLLIPLHCSFHHISRDTCCLSVYQEGMTPLLYAASKGHLEVVQYLISEGSEIESKDKVKLTKDMIFFFAY